MNFKHLIKKIGFYSFLLALVLLVSGTVALYLYKDRIINQVVRELNKALLVPVDVEKIDIEPFQHFPKVAVSFEKVFIKDPLLTSADTLLAAKKISLLFSIVDIWEGENSFENIVIENGQVNLSVNKKGLRNFNILKKEPSSGEPSSFNLKSISIKNVAFNWTDATRNSHYKLHLNAIGAGLFVTEKSVKIEARGGLFAHFMKTGQNVFLSDKNIAINNRITFELGQQKMDIHPGEIKINEVQFLLGGFYQFSTPSLVDITLQAEKTNLNEIISLLPENTQPALSSYNSDGGLYFTLQLKGPLGPKQHPSLDVSFGFINARLYHPDYDVQLNKINLTGNYHLSNLGSPTSGSLSLENCSGILNGESFSGYLKVADFKTPFMDFKYEGLIDLHSILQFYPIEGIKAAGGKIDLDISVKGRVEDLKKKQTVQRISTSGEIELIGVHVAHENLLPIDQLSGSLIFNKNDLAISNLKGNYGASDFLLNGFFRNIISFILFENQPLGIEADMQSSFLDVDELLAKSSNNSNEYSFSISPHLILDFNCNIDQLQFRRFTASNISGDLKVKKQKAASKNIKFESIGGLVNLSALVNASLPKAIAISSNATMYDINIDSAFYVFENFHQDFLLDNNLSGQINANVSSSFYLSNQLNLIPSSLTADISTSIHNGELNNFEPLQRLNKFLDGDGLKRLRFSEIQNNIHIEKGIIYLPEMNISTNVTSLTIGGTHAFDNNINYRIITPVKGKKKRDKDAAFGAIESDGNGRSMLFLKITGTTDNYQISYDTESVKKKIMSDLKKEVTELKDAFKNKQKETEPDIELDDDDYFDW